jgi:hypothetical protein
MRLRSELPTICCASSLLRRSGGWPGQILEYLSSEPQELNRQHSGCVYELLGLLDKSIMAEAAVAWLSSSVHG